nr:cytochrome b6/f subunit M [Ascoseira mirabilis]
MSGEILSISILCFSMVILGLSLGFLLLKIQE